MPAILGIIIVFASIIIIITIIITIIWPRVWVRGLRGAKAIWPSPISLSTVMANYGLSYHSA